MNILFLLIASALLHACWNAFLKNKGNSLNKVVILYTFISLISFPFLFVVKFPSLTTMGYLFVSVIAHTMYMHSLARAYMKSDFSVAYPFARGMAPMLTVLVLIIFLGQSISFTEIVGIFLIVSAIFFLIEARVQKINLSNILSSLYFPISISFYTLVDAFGIRDASSAEQYIVWLFFLIPIPLLIYVFHNDKINLKTTFVLEGKSIFVASLGTLTSYSIILWAFTQAPIHYVASIRESSIIFASLIGLLFFKEQGLKRRLAAAVILFIGVFLLEYVS